MALNFPSNPALDQLYQSGSSSTYLWNGDYWETSIPPTQVFVTALSSSFATTASLATRVRSTASSQNVQKNVLFVDSGTGVAHVDAGLRYNPSTNLLTTTASLAVTASVLPTPATSIQASNTTAQTFANLQSTTITGWTNQIAINAGEWNASTGVFTSAGPGTYLVACSLQLASHTYAGANSEVSFFTTISGGIGGGVDRFFNQVTNYSGLTPTLQFTCLVRFTAAGQTMRLQIYNATGNSMSNFTANNGTAITIQEVSRTISL